MASDTLTPTQQAFIQGINTQVENLLSTQLPGTFQMVNYPPGFNYGIQYSQPPVTSAITLAAFDSMLSVGTNGVLSLGNSAFSTTYFKILSGAAYQYSPSDQKVVQDPNLQSQQIAVTQEATSSGFVGQFPITGPVTYYAVVKSVLTNFGATGHQTISPGDITAAAKELNNAGFAGLGQAISSAINQLAPLNAILNTQSQASNELTAAQTNSQNPSATNGGLQTGTDTYYVGWSDLPTNNQVLGGLQSGSAVTISIQASNFSSNSTNLSISGSTGFTIPILDFIDIGISGGASYDMSKYTESSSSISMTMEYPGVSIVQANPTPLSTDYKTGWYDETLLQSIIKGSNDPNISGFKIPVDSQWNIHSTFGTGKTFSRLKTFVISQNPSITMTFDAGNSSAITTDFKENASANVKLFGLFEVGSISNSYQVKKVDTTSTAGKIVVTFAPPDITGTVPLEQQVCYVLGGVADYPPPPSS